MGQNKIKNYIYRSSVFLYFIFLSATMIFGRASSVINIKTPLGPVFVTEITLFICVFLFIIDIKHIFKLPKIFLITLSSYFFIGSVNFLGAMLKGNIFAFRDIVLFVYILFLPLTFVYFYYYLSNFDNKKSKVLIGSVILINMLGLVVGHFFAFYSYFPLFFSDFFDKMRSFNFGIYYGTAIAFLAAFFNIIKNRILKIFILILSSLNLYILMIFNVRTLWVALLFLFVFLLIILKNKFLKYIFNLIPVFVIIAGGLFYLDSKIMDTAQKDAILLKGKSMGIVTQNILNPKFFPTSLSETVYTKPDNPKDSFIPIPEKPPSNQFLSLSPKYNLGSIAWRLDIWRQTINFGFESPFFGKGFGVYPRYALWDSYVAAPKTMGPGSGLIPPHNHLVTVFYKTGFVGLGLFLFINMYVFIFGIRGIKRCKSDIMKYSLIGALGAFVFWHSSALFFDVIDSPPTSIFLWVIMGMIFAVINIDKRFKPRSEK